MKNLWLLVFFILVPHTYQNNLATLAQKHYEICDCLEKTGEPFEASGEIVLADCWAKCFTNNGCFAFEYCATNKKCSLFNATSIGFNFRSVKIGICGKVPTYGFSEFYIIKREEEGEKTFDCQGIKSIDPLAGDGYYVIKIRGVAVEVYCVMAESPAKIFLDVGGKSIWGGSDKLNSPPIFPVTRTWTRVQIQTSSCMTSVICDDVTFSQLEPHYDGLLSKPLYFGYGANCQLQNYQYPATMEVDLSSSPFFISTGIEFRMTGYQEVELFNSIGTDRQVVRVEGTARCGMTRILHLKQKKFILYRIPLLLNQR